MVFVQKTRRKTSLNDVAKILTRIYLAELDSDIKQKYPEEFHRLSFNEDSIVEVFRRSLSIALDLKTTNNCLGYERVCNDVAEALKVAISKFSIHSEDSKSAILQACMIHILSSISIAKGYNDV